jgi:hypothetical protein
MIPARTAGHAASARHACCGVAVLKRMVCPIQRFEAGPEILTGRSEAGVLRHTVASVPFPIRFSLRPSYKAPSNATRLSFA